MRATLKRRLAQLPELLERRIYLIQRERALITRYGLPVEIADAGFRVKGGVVVESLAPTIPVGVNPFQKGRKHE